MQMQRESQAKLEVVTAESEAMGAKNQHLQNKNQTLQAQYELSAKELAQAQACKCRHAHTCVLKLVFARTLSHMYTCTYTCKTTGEKHKNASLT